MHQVIQFSNFFMDDEFKNIYSEELRTGKIAIGFAVLAIFIACLGLFGLTSYAAEQRTKEIGIRKALGSSIFKIIVLLTKQVFYLFIDCYLFFNTYIRFYHEPVA
ncbi:MAG: hypothetical protein HC906_07470 [Bacteroidales bacterium]|nr:hypothetical protein [Bacteroidales bacterium]